MWKPRAARSASEDPIGDAAKEAATTAATAAKIKALNGRFSRGSSALLPHPLPYRVFGKVKGRNRAHPAPRRNKEPARRSMCLKMQCGDGCQVQ
jgi:hypothetical protein